MTTSSGSFCQNNSFYFWTTVVVILNEILEKVSCTYFPGGGGVVFVCRPRTPPV
jgi:hypothetical protein